MNLIVDVGNTKTKIALYNNYSLETYADFFNEQLDEILDSIASLKYEHSIILFSSNTNFALLKLLRQSSTCIEFSSSELSYPIQIAYKTKETLGKDRIAAVCGTLDLKNSTNHLVITAGTCITYNFLTNENIFLGGSISPGIYMRYNAMNYFTDKLPLVENKEFNKLIGRTTEESLQSGVRMGILAEVDGIIREYELLYPNLRVFICGGDTSFFVNRLKCKIFADQHLVLHGMNTILLHNI